MNRETKYIRIFNGISIIVLAVCVIGLSIRINTLEQKQISNEQCNILSYQRHLMFIQAFEDIRTNGVPKKFNVEIKTK